MRRLVCFVLPVVLIALAAGQARAGGSPPREQARDSAGAEALFRDGRARMEVGDYAHACPLFAESWRLDAALGTLFNLARCEELTGHLASAWGRYGELLDRLAPDDERRAVALERKAALDREVPRLTLVLVRAAPPGLQVTRDGVDLGDASLGLALPEETGAHDIVVGAAGQEARRYSITLAAGERLTLAVEPGPAIPPRASTRTAGYVVGGVGIASLAVGVALGVRALERRDASDADCTRGQCRDASGTQAYADARSSAVGADVAFGIGAVALAAGAYLAWLAPSARGSVGLTMTARGLGATF